MFFNIHDLVKIEFSNEPKEIQDHFKKRLGFFIIERLSSEADINVNFVPEISLSKGQLYVGHPGGTTVAYNSSSLCFTNFSKKVSVNLNNFENAKFNISCEIGIRPVELFHLLLFFFIQQVLIRKNATLVHASSLNYKNRGLLFPAWRDTGKTTIMLNFLSSQKAQFLSDDLTILKSDGTIYCLPDFISVRYPHTIKTGHIKKTRLLFSGYTRKRIQEFILPRTGKLLKLIYKPLGNLLIELGNRQAYGLLCINEIFPEVKIAPSCQLDSILFMIKANNDKITISEESTKNIVTRMASALTCEIDGSIPEAYQLFRFAFPEMGQRLLEDLDFRAREIIDSALTGKTIKQLTLPLWFNPTQVVDELVGFLEGKPDLNLDGSYENKVDYNSGVLVNTK